MTRGSSILAITLILPEHSGQVSMSILNTRLSLCAQVIREDCSAGVIVLSSVSASWFFSGFGTTSFHAGLNFRSLILLLRARANWGNRKCHKSGIYFEPR